MPSSKRIIEKTMFKLKSLRHEMEWAFVYIKIYSYFLCASARHGKRNNVRAYFVHVSYSVLMVSSKMHNDVTFSRGSEALLRGVPM
jgi:hypothetical protein